MAIRLKEVEQRGEKHFKLDMAKVKLTKEVCIKDRRIQELTQQQVCTLVCTLVCPLHFRANLFLQQVYEWKSVQKTRELKAKTRELQIQEMKSAAKTRELKAELQLHELQSVQKTRELEAKTRELEDKTRQLKVLLHCLPYTQLTSPHADKTEEEKEEEKRS